MKQQNVGKQTRAHVRRVHKTLKFLKCPRYVYWEMRSPRTLRAFQQQHGVRPAFQAHVKRTLQTHVVRVTCETRVNGSGRVLEWGGAWDDGIRFQRFQINPTKQIRTYYMTYITRTFKCDSSWHARFPNHLKILEVFAVLQEALHYGMPQSVINHSQFELAILCQFSSSFSLQTSWNSSDKWRKVKIIGMQIYASQRQ